MPVHDDSKAASSLARFAIILVLGPPGAGKGTLCAHLAKYYQVAHYSVGDGLRDWMRENRETPLAAAIRDKLDNQGFLSSQELKPFIKQAIESAVEQNTSGILIDGYPRNDEQYDALDSWTQELFPNCYSRRIMTPNLVLAVRVSKSNAQARYVARSRDARDSEEKFQRRFVEYEAETMPVEERYRERGRLIEVCADGTKDESITELERALVASRVWRSLKASTAGGAFICFVNH